MKIIKSFRKSLFLQIKNWELIVKAPFFTSKKTILNFLDKHKSWIEKRLKNTKNKINKTSCELQILKNKAKKYIPNRVEYLANKLGFKYNYIKITSAKTRWGSCTSKKNLNFSFYLIWAPKKVIDYVIIHELSHLIEMNHSKNFWNLVKKNNLNYKEYEKWLNNNWNTLH